MEWLQHLLDNSTVPLFTAFLLGLLTAVSPCPLATNITAIGFISKEVDSGHRVFLNGVLYTCGRVLTYVVIGLIVIPILREGTSTFAFQKVLGRYSEAILPPVLIVIGLFMLLGRWIHWPKIGLHPSGERIRQRGGWGAFLLGILFSLAFCPSSGFFYFGMLMPMSAMQSGGYFLPVVFAIATGLPVVLVAWILAYSVSSIGSFYHRLQVIRWYLNLGVALLFIGAGILLL